jgi:peptide/nickel transport system substrate-binding protein
MKLRNGIASNSRLVVILIMLVLVVGGGYYYFFRIPEIEEERTRLLTLNTEAEPSDLDPALAIETDSYRIIANVFDGLVKYKKGTSEIEPCLAKNWEEENPSTFIFHLRENVLFHDGTEFNAESVKYSFDRVMETDGPPSYLFWVINSTEVLDSYTVKINLNWDFSGFPIILASPVASIVSPTAVKELGDEFNEKPVGTGPFKFDSWDYGNELVLIAFDDYFDGSPKLEKLVFKTIYESTGRKEAILNGEIDVLVSGRILSTDLSELEANPDLRIYKGAGLTIEFLGFNGLKPPLNDSRIRWAIAYSLDYEEIISDALGGFGGRVGVAIPKGILGYKDVPLVERDLEKSIQLLEEAGYPDGFDITLTYNIESSERRQVAELIRDHLADVGINVNIKGLDWDSAINEYLDMGHELMLNTWFPDYFDPDSYLFPQFHSWSSAPYGANIFGLNNTELDNLLDEGLLTTEKEKREQIYTKSLEIINEEIPCLFLYVPIEFEVITFEVQNWVFNPTQMIEFYDIYKE